MRRSVPWSVILLLTAVTSGTIGALFSPLATPNVVEPRDVAAEAVVRAFYQAVNEVLATGETTALDDVVAPDHVEHAAAPGLPPTRDGLVRALRDLRVTHPDFRLFPEHVAATDGRVIAQVAAAGAAGSFLALPLGRAFAPWGPIDLFRVAGGRIIEHWGGAAEARVESLGRAPLAALDGTPQVLSLIQWSFPGHTRIGSIAGEGTRMLATATGILTVTIADTPGEPVMLSSGTARRLAPVPPGTTVTLAPGASLLLPSGTSFRVSNDADVPAVAVTASLIPPGAGEFDTVRFASSYPDPIATEDAAGVATFAGGVTMRPLAGSPMVFLPAVPVEIGVGRMVLAGGTELTPLQVMGPALIALEGGELELNAGAGEARVRRGESGSTSDAGKMALGPGDGAGIPPGTDFSLRNRGFALASLLFFVVVPAASDAASGSFASPTP
jgi:mannose-6-phosphate isomerase-like protein (cupin superfamily)